MLDAEHDTLTTAQKIWFAAARHWGAQPRANGRREKFASRMQPWRF